VGRSRLVGRVGTGMKTKSNNQGAGKEHESVRELLPWYANATLQPSEVLRVESHIATCGECRTELERCRRLCAATKDIDAQPWSPSPAHFGQVLAHIDRADRIAANSTVNVTSLRGLRAWIAGTPRAVQWAFGTQSVLLLVMAGALVMAELPQRSSYETLSHSEEPSTGARARVRLVLADDITGAQLRDLLQSVGGEIVHGPSQAGVYTIELGIGRTREASMVGAVELLRANPKVRLAEPIGNSAGP
jgi:Putative zinc-finger